MSAAYFFTTTALIQGIGAFLWRQLIAKYGRLAWARASMSYGSEVALRIIMGAAAEALAPLTISDIFLHKRSTVMAVYTCAFPAGVSCGIIIAGLISINNGWRAIYWVATALIGSCTLFVIFTFPMAMYLRDVAASSAVAQDEKKRSYVSSLRIFSSTYTQESLLMLFIRPVAFIILPQVLWGTLVMSGTIGFLIAITSNFAPAFETAYNFKPWQSGLCFVAVLLEAFIGIFADGHFSDWIADRQSQRNGGVREPEMRLPAILVSVVTAPLALVLYDVGIQYKLHWICPTFALGLINFSLVQATNVSLVYTSAFGFLLSFYTNPWVQKSGYLNAYGAMAGISSGLIILGVPFFVWGDRIRNTIWH
ncbi:hypothetical protein BU25DRAFT_437279 [Macroventuria anomochaeta]|uniref:Uncharacterized protein n=1 Tax=Macroventuria anomochaeta TaxID=301207 RepID=A0ACB6SE43_9PLEO|nr:uncharacterized protein BU25DRAFT_437279 [Macroventuria anomochaeta]KAF2631524.1 hypothetical protein BU25DRAFT_437279 [Macroventuria anomochaeta]